MACRKVSFLKESFALDYIKHLKRTSARNRKPMNTYLCPTCKLWHLTSQKLENKEVPYLKQQIVNLKKKNDTLMLEIDILKNIIQNPND